MFDVWGTTIIMHKVRISTVFSLFSWEANIFDLFLVHFQLQIHLGSVAFLYDCCAWNTKKTPVANVIWRMKRQIQYAPCTMLCLIITVERQSDRYTISEHKQQQPQRHSHEMMYMYVEACWGLEELQANRRLVKLTIRYDETITTKESTFTLYKYTRKREKAPQNKIVEFRSFTDYRHTGFNVWEHTQTIQGGAVAQVNIVSLLFLLYVELIHFSSGVHRLLLIEMKTSAAHSDDQRTHTIASLLMHIVHCGGCWCWWSKSMLPSGKQTAEGITSFCDLLCGIYETIRYCFSAYCVRCMGEYVNAKWQTCYALKLKYAKCEACRQQRMKKQK